MTYDLRSCVLSLRFNMDVRHIKITSSEGLYRINDKKAFKGIIVSPLTQPKPANPETFSSTERCGITLFCSSCPDSVAVLIASSGDGSLLPAELSKGVLQGRGHHAAYAVQAAGAEQLIKQHSEYDTRYNTATFQTHCHGHVKGIVRRWKRSSWELRKKRNTLWNIISVR